VHPKEGTFKVITEGSIVKADQSNWTENAQGVLVNIDWDTLSMD